MSKFQTVQERNLEVAKKVNSEALVDPDSPYAGKFVGIADGSVVVVADNLDEVVRQLQQSQADPARTFCIEAGLDYDAAAEIWKL